MSKLRMAAVAATLSCGLMLVGGTGIASAQDSPARLTQVVPVTGTQELQGHVHDRAVRQARQQGLLGRHDQGRGRQQARDQGERAHARDRGQRERRCRPCQPGAAAVPPLPPGNACSILSLDLGPINLNLLGLVVRTNQIQLRIDAVQGAGNLLGNLLCGITGILEPEPGRQHTAGAARADPERAARALATDRVTGEHRGGGGYADRMVPRRRRLLGSSSSSAPRRRPLSGRRCAGGNRSRVPRRWRPRRVLRRGHGRRGDVSRRRRDRRARLRRPAVVCSGATALRVIAGAGDDDVGVSGPLSVIVDLGPGADEFDMVVPMDIRRRR